MNHHRSTALVSRLDDSQHTLTLVTLSLSYSSSLSHPFATKQSTVFGVIHDLFFRPRVRLSQRITFDDHTTPRHSQEAQAQPKLGRVLRLPAPTAAEVACDQLGHFTLRCATLHARPSQPVVSHTAQRVHCRHHHHLLVIPSRSLASPCLALPRLASSLSFIGTGTCAYLGAVSTTAPHPISRLGLKESPQSHSHHTDFRPPPRYPLSA